MNRVFLVGISLAVISCASKPFPIVGPKASLTIEAPAYDVSGFQFYKKTLTAFVADDDSGCAFEGGSFKKGSLLYAANIESKEPKTTVEIPVGKEIYIRMHDSNGVSECVQGVRFKPVLNAQYELVVSTLDSSESARCSSKLFLVVDGNREEVESAKLAPNTSILKNMSEYKAVCN